MTPAPTRTTDRSLLRAGWRHALRHYLELVLAMVAGMAVLGAVDAVLTLLVGRPLSLGVEIDALAMATAMSVAMAAWMRRRGHRLRPVLEMSAAMYVPFVVLVLPLRAGAITPDELMMWGHVLMLPSMAAVMLLRPSEYTCPPARVSRAARRPVDDRGRRPRARGRHDRTADGCG